MPIIHFYHIPNLIIVHILNVNNSPAYMLKLIAAVFVFFILTLFIKCTLKYIKKKKEKEKEKGRADPRK